MGLLDGKVAIITGAARGIGWAHAKLFAQEGARLVINDLGGEWDGVGEDTRPAAQACEEIKQMGGEAVPNFANVADEEGARSLIQQAIDTFGKLDVLVCNAGILRDKMSFNMEPQDWDAVINVHLRGHFLPIHYAAAYWRERNKATGQPCNASILLTSSTSGLYGNAGQLNYGAAKAGIAAMAIILGRELAKYGVRANAIAPGARTRLTEGTFGSIPQGDAFDEMAPENNSPMVAWLASDDSLHVTGQVFGTSGDRVSWFEGWHIRREIVKPQARWTPEELRKATQELFGSDPTTPQDFPIGSWREEK
ncbi:MAG: SDR family oxidoreductase [Firmicutes bacterium]|nr:SDR family oxidoreductase [Bacillota bacterium]